MRSFLPCLLLPPRCLVFRAIVGACGRGPGRAALHRMGGETVYTDKRCEDIGAASRVIRPRATPPGQRLRRSAAVRARSVILSIKSPRPSTTAMPTAWPALPVDRRLQRLGQRLRPAGSHRAPAAGGHRPDTPRPPRRSSMPTAPWSMPMPMATIRRRRRRQATPGRPAPAADPGQHRHAVQHRAGHPPQLWLLLDHAVGRVINPCRQQAGERSLWLGLCSKTSVRHGEGPRTGPNGRRTRMCGVFRRDRRSLRKIPRPVADLRTAQACRLGACSLPIFLARARK